jgi:hypothetical protein
MADLPHAEPPIERVARRLASLLSAGGGGGLVDPSGSSLVFEPSLSVRALRRAPAPPGEVWAVDGGQALVADARCLQVYVTRSATVCFSDGRLAVESASELQPWLLGLGEDALARSVVVGTGAPVAGDRSVDVNLLREWGEWAAAARCVSSAVSGSLVLVDGDLQPDWRLSGDWLAALMDLAAERGVVLAGVTKQTGLAWDGQPLVGALERLASSAVADRECWWCPVARTSGDVGPGVQVVVARLDPDARFAFRVDLPGDADPVAALSRLSTVCDDAAFPGYPYPLSAADRLAACPSWVRDEVWSRLTELIGHAGVPEDVVERAFADRHRLMERY